MAIQQNYRRFDLLDLVAVLAALAVGMAFLLIPEMADLDFAGEKTPEWYQKSALKALTIAQVVLLPLGPTVLALQVRRPRRRGRRAWFRPGLVACAAMTGALLMQAASILVMVGCMGSEQVAHDEFLEFWPDLITQKGDQVFLAILGAWSSLICTRAWRSEPSWPDRVGRLLGLLWITAYLLNMIFAVIAVYAGF